MILYTMLENTDHEAEVVKARGHENVSARHKTTFEITREAYLTPRGDCIIGVEADKALSDFNNNFKKLVRNKYSIVMVFLKTENSVEMVLGHGDPRLTYSDSRRIIVRKSSYVDQATAVVKANKAAVDIDRQLVHELQRGSRLTALFIVISFNSINTVDEFVRSIINNPGNPRRYPVV